MMTSRSSAFGSGPGKAYISLPFTASRSPPFLTLPRPIKCACRAKSCCSQRPDALESTGKAVAPAQLLRHVAAIACIGLLQLGHPVLAAEQPGPAPASPSNESTAAPPSPAAVDDKTRLVRSVLLQDGASEAQASSPETSGSSSRVEGQSATDLKAKSPAPEPNAASPAPAQIIESSPILPPSAPPSATPSVPPAPAKDTNGAASGGRSLRQEETEKEAKKLLDEEEERRKTRRRKKGRIRELEEIRAELAEKELVLLGKEQELLERDQTVQVLREELDLERKLRTLLTKEKEKAEEEAALSMGLCTGGSIF